MDREPRSDNLLLRLLGAQLVAALARLALVGAVAAWLVVFLLNEIAAALVYVIITALTLLFSSCPPQ